MVDTIASILQPLLLVLIFFILARQAIHIWRTRNPDKHFSLKLLYIIMIGALYGVIATDGWPQVLYFAAILIVAIAMSVMYWIIYADDDNDTMPDLADIDPGIADQTDDG